MPIASSVPEVPIATKAPRVPEVEITTLRPAVAEVYKDVTSGLAKELGKKVYNLPKVQKLTGTNNFNL